MYGQDIERIIKKLEELKDKTYEKIYKLCEDTSYRLNHLAKHKEEETEDIPLPPPPTSTPPDTGRWIMICKEAKKQLYEAYKENGGNLYDPKEKLDIDIDNTTDDMILDCPGFVAGCISVFGYNHIEKTLSDFAKEDEEIIDAGFGILPFPGWDNVQQGDILVLKDKRVEVVDKVNSDNVSVYSFESDEQASTKDPTESPKDGYQLLWRLTMKPPNPDDDIEDFNCIPKEKPVSVDDPIKSIKTKYNSLKSDIDKIIKMGSSLYVKKEEFNNSIGSPFKEFKQLQDVVEDVIEYSDNNSPYKWLSQKASMLALLNTIIHYCNDCKYAITIYSDYVQRGYDHKYNDDTPSLTWKYSLDDNTMGNLFQDYDENVNIKKKKDYDIY